MHAQTRWLVELVLPGATLACRPVVTSRTLAELDLEAHGAMAELLAWKSRSPRCAGTAAFPINPVPSEPLPNRRLMLAHVADASAARPLLSDLQAVLTRLAPPWSEITRAVFMHHVHEAQARS